MDSKIWIKKVSPARYSLRTLCYDPHLSISSYFYLYCHDIPPIIVRVTICTVLHGTGVLVCPAHDALKAIDGLLDYVITSRNARLRRAYLLWRILRQAVEHQLHMHGVPN